MRGRAGRAAGRVWGVGRAVGGGRGWREGAEDGARRLPRIDARTILAGGREGLRAATSGASDAAGRVWGGARVAEEGGGGERGGRAGGIARVHIRSQRCSRERLRRPARCRWWWCTT